MNDGKESPMGSEEIYVESYLKKEKMRPKNRDAKKLLDAIDRLIYEVSTNESGKIKVNIYDLGFEEGLGGSMEAEAFFKKLDINATVDIEATKKDMSYIATLENLTLSKLQNYRKKILGLDTTTRSHASKKRKEIMLILYTDHYLCREPETNRDNCYLFRLKKKKSKRFKILEYFVNNQNRTISSEEMGELINYDGAKARRSFKGMFQGIAKKLKIRKKLYDGNNNGYTLICKIINSDKKMSDL